MSAGLRPGDVVLSVNGCTVRDQIDIQFMTDGDPLTLRIDRPAGEFTAVLDGAVADLGLEFEHALFDGTKTCANRCLFCFVDQLPPGLRAALTVKDDDFRLSFLHGTYVTLTNLAPADEQRIINQRLSPLYVSVHAVTDEVRRILIGPRAEKTISSMHMLAAAGIRFHCQIVLCPGYNDGAELERTLAFLHSLGPVVRSVSVVPVGLTAHRDGLHPLAAVTPDGAARALDTVLHWRDIYRAGNKRRGVVQASDELYLLAARDIPPASDYDGFPQLENGVGLVREFIDQWTGLQHPRKQTAVITGRLFFPILERLLDGAAHVIPIDNRLFGPSVTVAGLVSGADIITQLKQQRFSCRDAILPDTMVRAEDRDNPAGGLFVDGMTPDDVARALGVRVRVVSADALALARELEEE